MENLFFCAVFNSDYYLIFAGICKDYDYDTISPTAIIKLNSFMKEAVII